MKEVLKVKNLTKTYLKKKKKIIVLNHLNCQFSEGKFYCVNGKSGAGKTTLVEILGLLKGYDEGQILVDNQDVSKLNSKQKSNLRNQKIGFVFQSFYLIPTMTAIENVMLPMYLDKTKSKKEIRKRALDLLNIMGLKDRESHYPKELSGGEQQRVAIARALINNPTIILADEPAGSLDSENEDNILNILKDLAKDGKCVIVVSHNEKTIKYADEVIEIKSGGLICKTNALS